MSELNAYKGDVTIPVYGTIADADVYLKKDVDAVIAELKQKLEDAQREVNNYRRHANECEGLAAKGDIDKVSLLEEIKDLKNDKELLDSQLYGFLQLEEECGGGDLRNYIAELKQKLESVQASMYADVVDANMDNRRLKRALYKACANWAHAECMWASLLDFKCPETWDEMERKCLKKAEEYK